jgi:hypothetical protein
MYGRIEEVVHWTVAKPLSIGLYALWLCGRWCASQLGHAISKVRRWRAGGTR